MIIRGGSLWRGMTLELFIIFCIFINICTIRLACYSYMISQNFGNIGSSDTLSKRKAMSGFRKQPMGSVSRLSDNSPSIFRWLSKFIINEKFVIYVLYELQENIAVLHFIDSFLLSTLFHLSMKDHRTDYVVFTCSCFHWVLK